MRRFHLQLLFVTYLQHPTKTRERHRYAAIKAAVIIENLTCALGRSASVLKTAETMLVLAINDAG
jgi:hypothetical protein